MKVVVIFFTTFFFMINNAFALRCGNSLVERGDRKIEVILKCGKPTLVDEWIEEIYVYDNDNEIDERKTDKPHKRIKGIAHLNVEE